MPHRRCRSWPSCSVPACASSGGRFEAADDPTLVAETAVAPNVQDLTAAASEAKGEGEAEVPAAVAESEQRETPPKTEGLPELVVEGRERHLVIRDLVAEGQAQLRDVELQYAFIGKGGREVLRGRPVAFALWSEAQKNWTIADLEIPSSAGEMEARPRATALHRAHARH